MTILLSTLAAALVGLTLPDPAAGPGWASAPIEAQVSGGTYRRDELPDEYWRDRRLQLELRRILNDCHRDVRTHWLNGAKVTHRHVGENCTVRIVRRSSVPGG